MPAVLILVTMVEHATIILLAATTAVALLVTMAQSVKRILIGVQQRGWSTAMAMVFVYLGIVIMKSSPFQFATVLANGMDPQSARFLPPTMSVNMNLRHVAMESVTTSPLTDTLVNAHQVSK